MTATRLRRRVHGHPVVDPWGINLPVIPLRSLRSGGVWLVVDLLVGPIELRHRWYGLADPFAVLGG